MRFFDSIAHAYHLLAQKKKESFLLSLTIAVFLVVLVMMQASFLTHIQSLITTLGAYIQALTDSVATNESPLAGYSLVSYILADSVVKQGLWKVSIAYLGLIGSFFLIWNVGVYSILKKLKTLVPSLHTLSFGAFTKRNIFWMVLFIVYSIVYLGFNLKFTLVDQVILGSTWQQSVLGVVNNVVRLLFAVFILHSYAVKSLKSVPSKNHFTTILACICSLYVFDFLLGQLLFISSFVLVVGFVLLISIVTYFLILFYLQPFKHKLAEHTAKLSKKVVWGHAGVFLMLLLLAFPFGSFFLLTGLDESGVLVERVDIQSIEDLATLLRTTPQEILLLKESGVSVVVIEFSDFDCPFCASAQAYVSEIHERDSIFVYRRHFPVTAIHPQSYVAALYYECLKDEGVAQSARDFLFSTQNARSYTTLTEFSQGLSITNEQLDTCMESRFTKSRIEHDIIAAKSLGISATPTFVAVHLESVNEYQVFDGAVTTQMELFFSRWAE